MSAKTVIILVIVLLLALWYFSPDNFSKLKQKGMDISSDTMAKLLQGKNYTKMTFSCMNATHCNEAISSCNNNCLCADTGDCIV